MIRAAICCMMFFFFSFANAQMQTGYGSNPLAGNYKAVNGIRLYYEVYGTGHPLLLMHGNGGSISDMGNQIADLSEHFRVIAVDSRAQGRSTDADQELSFSLLASDMAVLLDSLGIDSVFSVGYSDGGIVGLELAFLFPRKVSRLVAISANFRPDTSAFPADMVEHDRTFSFNELDPATQADIIRNSRDPDRAPLIFNKLLDLDRNHPHLSTRDLGSIHTPTLVVAADHDLIKITHTLELFHALPQAELCIIPGANHGLIHQKPALLDEAIIEYLEGR